MLRFDYTCGVHNRNTLQLCVSSTVKSVAEKCVTKGPIWICMMLLPSIKITLEMRGRARHLASRYGSAIKKSSPWLSSWTTLDCISWRLILNCAINVSDKCVKTAIVVIETRDAPSAFTHPRRYAGPRERRGWLFSRVERARAAHPL